MRKELGEEQEEGEQVRVSKEQRERERRLCVWGGGEIDINKVGFS